MFVFECVCWCVCFGIKRVLQEEDWSWRTKYFFGWSIGISSRLVSSIGLVGSRHVEKSNCPNTRKNILPKAVGRNFCQERNNQVASCSQLCGRKIRGKVRKPTQARPCCLLIPRILCHSQGPIIQTVTNPATGESLQSVPSTTKQEVRKRVPTRDTDSV